jgi:hypothetical protein
MHLIISCAMKKSLGEEFCLLGYNTLYSGENQRTFRTSSLRLASLLLGLLFDPKDTGDIFLRNVCLLSSDYMALYPR